MTPGECKAMLAIAMKAFGRTLAREAAQSQADSWAEFLQDITAEEGVKAIRQHVTESPHFPTIADIRRRVAESRVDPVDIGAAWGEVKRAISRVGYDGSPSWSHPAITHAVESLGWRTICHTLDDDVPTLRAQFERYFRGYLDGARRQANSGALEAHQERVGQLGAGAVVAKLALVKKPEGS
jgi:hypothetical protein